MPDASQSGTPRRRSSVATVCRNTFGANHAGSHAAGYARTGARIREALDNALRTAVRRGILANDGDGLRLRYRGIEQYEADDRDGLKEQFLAALDGRNWQEREAAVLAFARRLGFHRTGSKIEEVAASLINGLLRDNRLDKDGSRIHRAG